MKWIDSECPDVLRVIMRAIFSRTYRALTHAVVIACTECLEVSQSNRAKHILLNHYIFRCPVRKPNKLRTSLTNLRARKKGIRCNRSLSVGSEIQPSIGIAFAVISTTLQRAGTFVPGITNGRVIENTNFSHILFNNGEIFDVCSVFDRAVLSIISCFKKLSLGL
jgi:hypothetical protein